MRLSRVCVIVLIQLMLLSVHPMLGSVEEYALEGTQFTGQMFLHQPDGKPASGAGICGLDEKGLPASGLHPLARRFGPEGGAILPQREPGKSFQQQVGSERIKLIGQAPDEGGMANDVLAKWELLLRCNDRKSDPSDPQLIGQCGGSYTCGVVVSGNFAYVADDDLTLRVIDITDPLNPDELRMNISW